MDSMQPSRSFEIGKFTVGGGSPLFLIAGPCVIESEAHAMMMAERLCGVASELGIPLIFKASYDKANRSSVASYRGPGLAGRPAHPRADQKAHRLADSYGRSRGFAC